MAVTAWVGVAQWSSSWRKGGVTLPEATAELGRCSALRLTHLSVISVFSSQASDSGCTTPLASLGPQAAGSSRRNDQS